MGKTKKITIDWSSIERDFREGSMSIREIASWYQISDTAIRKKAKASGWERENHNSSHREPQIISPHVPPPLAVQTDLRSITGRGRNLVLRLMDELDTVTTHQGVLEEMIIEDTSGDRDNRRRSAMMNAVALPARANIVKALAAAAKSLADIHRVPQGSTKPDSPAEAANDEDTKQADGWAGLLN